jgi:signal transduction histidine kinase/CHASE3 domain sensor protein/ActR/RegA family two-component response regulator
LFLAAGLSFLAVVALSVWSAVSYVSASWWVNHAVEVRQEAYEWLASVIDAEMSARGYVLTGQQELLEPYQRALSREREKAAILKRLVADNPAQTRNVLAADDNAEASLATLRDLVALERSGRRAEALTLLASGDSRRNVESFRAWSARIRADEERLLVARRDQATRRGLLGLGAAALLAGGAIAFLATAWRRDADHQSALSRLTFDARARLKALSEVGVALSNTRTRSQVADVIVDQGMRAAGADTCTLHMFADGKDVLDLVGHRGVSPEIVDVLRRVTESSLSTTFVTLKSGKAVWVENEAEYRELDPHLASMKGRRAQAFWGIPLLAEDRAVGVLAMGFDHPRSFSADERTFIETIANQCAQALLLAHRAENDATAKKQERDRTEFLAKAGEALVSSLDYQTTLAMVTRLAVPTLADWCTVHLVEPGATAPRQVAVAHADAKMEDFAREYGLRYPADPNATIGIAQVIRTGKSELYTDVTDELLVSVCRDPEELRMLRELRLRSAKVVALRTRGRTFGAMTFVFAESGRRYTEDHLAFAEDFARRAAMAIENSLALKEAEQRRREAEIANRAKDDFLATVSHELRTPLNAILGWTVALRGRKPPPEMDRALAVVERNARAQAKLISDVLDVSRIVSGKLTLTFVPTEVGEAARAAIESVSPAAQSKSISIQAEIPAEPIVVAADPDRLQQIVWNLLSNAVKFTPRSGVVTVKVAREGSSATISATDTGEGIRPEVLQDIFEPFRQADATTTRRHGGLGLGLSIVKQLVSAHGGSVSARSEGADRGSTFQVRLPVKGPAATTGRVAPAAAVPGAAPPPTARLDGLRVLVVDDEQDALNLLDEVLKTSGAEVHTAGSATEALSRLGSIRPDVLVSDIGMPDVDGYALIRRVRSLPSSAGGTTPAVALTAYARAEDALRAFTEGYQMHVTKPVEPAQLAAVVAKLGAQRAAHT